ncbi:hypothetical protein BDN70DRAFT_936933 [Pholiota conissans]|uniref:Uncharacterized protein n=1 Tax=Pholiota conissans TaxID=109636 RepID=A0A9P5YT16_9AGAR|nr:hypothetical protein BDN70DRAFT_936933 [Pholiota conissans]
MTSISEPDGTGDATYPLTLFDNMAAGLVIVMGWLVEGTVDVVRLEEAVDRVVDKWKMLGGRVEKIVGMYQMRVPLGAYPSGYKRYTITSQTSAKPLKNYVSLPFGLSHDPLPTALFKHSDTPRNIDDWLKSSTPLLNWHITHFPAAEGGESYSCIGVTFPHVVFDGMGVASVVHAVEAELSGNEWLAPALVLRPGLNKNPVLVELDKSIQKRIKMIDNVECTAVGLISFWWIICFSAWSYWQSTWHQSRDRIIVMPAAAVKKLVEDARRESSEATGDDTIQLSRGDVIAGFLFKTIFSDKNAHQDTAYRMCSLASLRRFFDGELSDYPHNIIIPIPYKRYASSELQKTSLLDLAYQFSVARREFVIEDVLRCYDIMLEGVATKRPFLFFDPNVDESSVLTNACIANIANINWTGTGGGRTLCRYKTSIRKPPLTNLTNIITIAGYLDNGSLVIQSSLTKVRFERLKQSIRKLLEETYEK